MTLSRARLEDINLHYYIKHEVLGLEFVEQYTNQSLSYDSSTALYLPDYSDMLPSPVSPGRGWVQFDEAYGVNAVIVTAEQVSRVSVVGASTYTVNYIYGGIGNPDTAPSTASFQYHYVSVLDGWPSITTPDLPVVAIDILGQSRKGFQLGPGYLSSRPVDLHIFASTAVERDDLSETLFDAVYNKSIPVIDYSSGEYLTPAGVFDTSFTRAAVLEGPRLFFDDVSQKTINRFSDWSDLNKHRSMISFNMTVYKG